MGYSAEHTEQTRRRILEAAGRLFRREGYAGARIDAIMEEAGLTRGGFYAHFPSKQALFAACMGQELEFTERLREAAARDADDPIAGARAAIEYYLTPGNRRKIARGCSIVSNAADMARADAATRRAFSSVYDDLAAEFEALARAADARGDRAATHASDEADHDPHGAPTPRERALAALATCVGGVLLARATSGEARIEELLGACRSAVLQALVRSRRAEQ